MRKLICTSGEAGTLFLLFRQNLQKKQELSKKGFQERKNCVTVILILRYKIVYLKSRTSPGRQRGGKIFCYEKDAVFESVVVHDSVEHKCVGRDCVCSGEDWDGKIQDD